MMPPAGPDPVAVDPVVVFNDLLKNFYRFVGDEPFEEGEGVHQRRHFHRTVYGVRYGRCLNLHPNLP